WLFPNLVWKINTTEKELFLTFDDGPVPGPTEFVLETLQKFNCKATFFCIGDNIRKHTEIFQKVVNDGHAIGNHTFNHISGWDTSLEKYVDNIKQCDLEIRNSKFEIRTSRLFRPPYGRVTRKQIKTLADYKIIMWDVLTIDYDKNVSPESCLKNSLRVTRPGSIIVFHDSLKAERNMMYALPRYIEHFLEQGYTFKALPV
ncbi:MAG TPA: polysaccharide deacetylase family protein, partial [Cyclobacteriaceae bacterium]|nr:polysaccharide deacetylase family protein [Cyclobacteriaceae bacterium]